MDHCDAEGRRMDGAGDVVHVQVKEPLRCAALWCAVVFCTCKSKSTSTSLALQIRLRYLGTG